MADWTEISEQDRGDRFDDHRVATVLAMKDSRIENLKLQLDLSHARIAGAEERVRRVRNHLFAVAGLSVLMAIANTMSQLVR